MSFYDRTPLIALASAALIATPGLAQENEAPPRWSVGAGAALITSPYADVDDTITPIPYFSFVSGRVSVSPFGLGVNLLQSKRVSVDALVAPRFQPADYGEEESLEGMENRGSTAEAGLRISFRPGFGEIQLEATSDVLGRHGGQIYSAGYGFGLSFGDLSVTPSARVQLRSARFTDYYYGVEADEARPGRPAYEVKSALTPSVGLDVKYALTPHVQAVAITSFEFFDSEITDSPIIDDDSATFAVVGLIYAF